MTQPLLLISILFVASAVRAQPPSITPFLTCVTPNPQTNTLTAYFGYESSEQAIVQVMVGNDNRFVPNPANRGQPTLFLPGYFEKAFRVTLAADQFSQWVFLGIAVTISPDSNRCPADLSLPAGVVMLPYAQQLAAAGGQSTLSWLSLGPLPAGLSLSPGGLLTGTPTVAGQYTLPFQVSDGISSSQRSYQLLITNTLAINDAISTRAPGFTPQLRVVTNIGATITTTAACSTNEFVLTGGGGCTVPNSNTVQGRIASSGPAGNGWQVTCSGGTATATAVCSK